MIYVVCILVVCVFFLWLRVRRLESWLFKVSQWGEEIEREIRQPPLLDGSEPVSIGFRVRKLERKVVDLESGAAVLVPQDNELEDELEDQWEEASRLAGIPAEDPSDLWPDHPRGTP